MINPLLLALANYVIWGERLSRSLGIGIGLGMLGSVCITWNDFRGLSAYTNDQALFGDFLALCGAVLMSAYLLCGRLVRTHIPLSVYVGAVYACAAGLLTTACLIFGLPFGAYSGQTYCFLALLGLGPQLIGHTTLNWALAYLSPTVVALAILGEPVGASVLAWVFLGETVSWFQVLGGGLIITGISLGRSERPD
jgi:drug/metabolite transporter (DMT)-like permease